MGRLRTVSDLGDVIRAARVARGWTQQEAADAAGISRRLVNMLEGGEHANAEVRRLLALLDALDIHLVVAPSTTDFAFTPAVPATKARGSDELDLDAYSLTSRAPWDSQ